MASSPSPPSSPFHGMHTEVLQAVYHMWNNEYREAERMLQQKRESHPRYSLEYANLYLVWNLMNGSNKGKEENLKRFQKADNLATAFKTGRQVAEVEVEEKEEEEEDMRELGAAVDDDEVLDAATDDKTPESAEKKAEAKRPSMWARGWSSAKAVGGAIGAMSASAVKAATGNSVPKIPTDPASLRLKLEYDVIYADAMLVRSIIQLRMCSYVKGAVNLRKTWGYYQALLKIVDERAADIPEEIVDNIKYGAGTFYIFLTLVPSGLMKVLSAIGFISDSELGESYLEQVLDRGGVRAPFAALVLLTFYLFLPTGLADMSETLAKAKRILDKANEKYPMNSYFWGYTNFYHRKKGEVPQALVAIEKAIGNVHKGDGIPLLLKYLRADTLFMGLQWKEATVAYKDLRKTIVDEGVQFEFSGQLVMTLSASLAMMGELEEAKEWMNQVPTVTNQKSKQDANSPKFANRCIADERMLALAGYHCLYINRDMAHMKPDALEKLSESLEECKKGNDLDSPELQAMVLLFEGVIAKGLKRPEVARERWTALVAMEKTLGPESPTLPFGYYELGELEYRSGNLKAAKALFDAGVKVKGDRNETLQNRYNRAIRHLNKHLAAEGKK
eukprot:Sspe_Gene.75494::Locus_47168_Transcript_1_1_Confidence_1.000_Length_3695::g.75494::m.75494